MRFKLGYKDVKIETAKNTGTCEHESTGHIRCGRWCGRLVSSRVGGRARANGAVRLGKGRFGGLSDGYARGRVRGGNEGREGSEGGE